MTLLADTTALLSTEPVSHPINQQLIKSYYEIAGMDYSAWSKNFNMHFGYCKHWTDAFNLEKMLNRMNEVALEKLQVPENQAVKMLDMGCGMGTVARFIAHRVPLAHITGITIVPLQIEYGNKLAKNENVAQRVAIVENDYEKTDFADESFDFAYAVESGCYAQGEGKGLLIKEMQRVLKPGGRFVLIDGFLKRPAKQLPAFVKRINDKICECWALTEGFPEINSFTKHLHTQGLQEIIVKEISWKIAPSVAYVPYVTTKFFFNEVRKNKGLNLAQERWNNVMAPALGMLLGLCRPYFGYYVISGQKPITKF
ncbi:MAG: methyltransferase domain-containing protein [Verrucomicrobia bacterium]|nr:methyltransferase domain-containing protein [Cytophagales bacterium]